MASELNSITQKDDFSSEGSLRNDEAPARALLDATFAKKVEKSESIKIEEG